MKRLKSMFQNRIFKGIFMISSGTGLAQLLNLVLQPIITRIYTPDQYGVLTIYIAILSLLIIVGSLRYESGIAIADDDEKAINVLTLSLMILIITVSLLTIIIFIFDKTFLNMFNAEVIYKYRYLIPLGIFAVGLYNIFSQWALRKKNYLSLSKTKINQSVSSNITKIFMGLLKFGPIGLIIGQIIGTSAGIITLARPLFKEQRDLLKKIKIHKIKWALRRYVRFPLYSAPSQFLNTAGIQLPILFLTQMFGAKVAGLYGLATSVVNMPMGLIGNAVGDVFYSESASIGRENPQRVKELSSKIILRLFLIGLIPAVTLILVAPFLFSIVFGTEWYEAGLYARVIAVLVLARLVFTPISRVFAVFEEQKKGLLLDMVRVTLVVVSFGISILFNFNPYWTIGLYSAFMSIVYFITYLTAQSILNKHIRKQK